MSTKIKSKISADEIFDFSQDNLNNNNNNHKITTTTKTSIKTNRYV